MVDKIYSVVLVYVNRFVEDDQMLTHCIMKARGERQAEAFFKAVCAEDIPRFNDYILLWSSVLEIKRSDFLKQKNANLV